MTMAEKMTLASLIGNSQDGGAQKIIAYVREFPFDSRVDILAAYMALSVQSASNHAEVEMDLRYAAKQIMLALESMKHLCGEASSR